MNQFLVEPYTADEFKCAVFGIFPLKSSGSDDDTLVFCEVKEEKLGEIKRIMEIYAWASGQVVNFKRSTMVVNFKRSTMVVSGKNVVERKRHLAKLLGVRLVANHDCYLGLSVMGGGLEVLFRNIRERYWERINGWNGKLLSQAGKGMLIKVVLQSLHNHAMSCF
ncbi:UNVERIFIED_CONTAM: hypothetical protein Slati_4249000 [Sesamum latifolium]|uniref:Uncharacterized protein n=1 Tax=Sesamum latifolium TaxID=2727402 RepID=A0AAW2TEP0_9LAMI